MHIAEGVLSAPILISGAVLGAGGLMIGLRKLDQERLMTAAILSAAFFVAGLIHFPVGPSCAHLLLAGFIALILGWAAFPAIFVALILQAALFQMGGLTTLGANLVIMTLPAVLFARLCRPWLFKGARPRFISAFVCGVLSLLGTALLTALALGFTSEGFLLSAKLIFLAHLPLLPLEGLITALALSFIARVRPEIFQYFQNLKV